MRTITADFNSRFHNGIRLDGNALREKMVRAGHRIRVTDDYQEVEAEVVNRDGMFVAVPDWSTLDYVH